MKKDKYYKLGELHSDEAHISGQRYWDYKDLPEKIYPECKSGSWQACSWEDGWNARNQERYANDLAAEVKAIKKKYGFTDSELTTLKQFFTDDLQDQINEIKRCV